MAGAGESTDLCLLAVVGLQQLENFESGYRAILPTGAILPTVG